jgi:hypothetical protein
MDKNVINITKKIALNTHQYNHIFYIKPEFPIEDNRIRSTNPEFQKAVDSMYENFLKEHNIPFHYLTGSVDERISQIKKILYR